jgi:hypothetical protein
MDLPIYKVTIDDFTGVEAIAIVDSPAIEVGYQRYSKQKTMQFSIQEEKRVLSGPIMIADLPIYRFNEAIGEHYVMFDAQVIADIVQKFFREGRQLSINLQHDPSMVVTSSYFFESFIINRERGVMPPKGYEKLADGSWFGSLKVDDERVWKVVRDEQFKGFSIEGLFNHELLSMKKEESVDSIFNAIARLVDEALTEEN